MINPNESDEREYLDIVLNRLYIAYEKIEQEITDYSKKILETKRYIWENLSQLDLAERAANRIAVHEDIIFGEKAITEKEKIKKLINSPYFGRIDFTTEGNSTKQSIYIGVHAFNDDEDTIIFDWRAPVSSMFYDSETGPVFYMAPMGKIEGSMDLKRQYLIRNSQMEYMIESSLNISDDILQKELSQNSDEKMKNIVATIQREQNAIIRNESAKVLIIQGSAGSGKTSIALHRVAYLLYRHKQVLTSDNIMIISPNKVFGNYISNVLPELGEENIPEKSFEDIAAGIIDKKYKYRTFAQQVENLLHSNDADVIAQIEYKATNEFVELLKTYLEYADDEYFNPVDLHIGLIHISKKSLKLKYQNLKRLPIKKRLEKISIDLITKYNRKTGKKLGSKTIRFIKDAIFKMFLFPDAALLYKNFYHHIGKKAMFHFAGKNTFQFCDVFPFVYVKMFYEGVEQDHAVIKHLIIDEMQDYTPIQYAVLTKLFSCKMTILGDSNQNVNPYSSSSAEKIRPFFEQCECIELCKSYRSTIEISNFAQMIKRNKKLIPVERHGKKPVVTECKNEMEQLKKILDIIDNFKKSGFSSLGIICRSQKQANRLYELIKCSIADAALFEFDSSEFEDGIIITSIHMSKGLEFDQVIIPEASADNYKTELDRNLLYIACTRAMHELDIIYWRDHTGFIDNDLGNYQLFILKEDK